MCATTSRTRQPAHSDGVSHWASVAEPSRSARARNSAATTGCRAASLVVMFGLPSHLGAGDLPVAQTGRLYQTHRAGLEQSDGREPVVDDVGPGQPQQDGAGPADIRPHGLGPPDQAISKPGGGDGEYRQDEAHADPEQHELADGVGEPVKLE